MTTSVYTQINFGAVFAERSGRYRQYGHDLLRSTPEQHPIRPDADAHVDRIDESMPT